MSAQAAITSLLLAAPALTALVGDRVHWLRLPETVNGRPYLNLQVVNDPLFYLHGAGVSSYRETFLQADAWADTHAQADAVAQAMIDVISGFRGAYGGVLFRGIWITGARDMEGSMTGGESQLFRRNVDLKTSWQME